MVIVGPAVIRVAEREDEQALRRIRASAGWAVEYVTRAFAEMAGGRRVVYVAELDAQPIGTVQLVFESHDPALADGRELAHLSDLVVLPAYQGRGVGRQLVNHVEDAARQRGFRTLTLDVDEGRPDIQGIYERWGYVYFRRTVSPWGTWLNSLQKPLRRDGRDGRDGRSH